MSNQLQLILDQLQRASTATICDLLVKKGLRQCYMQGLQPMNPGSSSFAGEAVTIRYIPAREDLDTYAKPKPEETAENIQWRIIDAIEAGQVLVIDSGNDTRAASIGNVLGTRLMVRGAAAVVTDGALRDASAFSEMPFPAFAREVSQPSRAVFHHVADGNVPIGCAGVAVYPGDIIVGDRDGVVVIPRHLAQEIAAACEHEELLDEYLCGRVAAGDALPGLYPPNDSTMAAFNEWKQVRVKL